MKEVFTKNFWRDVKKTFDDALKDPPAEANTSTAPEGESRGSPPAEDASAPPTKSDQT
jgi:hypothetical protein